MDRLHPLAYPKSTQTNTPVCSMSQTILPTDFYTIESGPGYAKAHEHNAITCLAGGDEMLRVTPEGFWVRGKRVAQDDNEAETVYNAFKAWMTWATLNKDYK